MDFWIDSWQRQLFKVSFLLQMATIVTQRPCTAEALLSWRRCGGRPYWRHSCWSEWRKRTTTFEVRQHFRPTSLLPWGNWSDCCISVLDNKTACFQKLTGILALFLDMCPLTCIIFIISRKQSFLHLTASRNEFLASDWISFWML